MKIAKRRQERPEGGFALLIVFLMAAAVAFTLYQQLPRVAFESVREKEQLLMDRGNQYKRAIQVFYAVNKRYPAKIEDLENTNNQRFLRRRYIDPMTGKDEWRLVHTNGSALTDSLVEKPPTAGQITQNGLPGAGPLGANTMNTAAPAAAAASDAVNGQAPAVNAAVAARPSDRPLVPDQTAQNQPTQNQPGSPGAGFPGVPALTYDPSDPRTWPAITIATASPQTGAQNGANAANAAGNTSGNPAGGFPAPGQANINGGQQVALTPGGGFSGQGFNGQQPGLGGQNPQQINVNGAGNPGNGGPAATAFQSPFADGSPNPALGLIGNQLTQSAATVAPSTGTPNQTTNQTPAQAPSLASGLTSAIQSFFPSGSSTTTGSAATATSATTNSAGAGATSGTLGGTTGGPGIAGVASTHQGPSIKSYKERLKYQEWEFVYEPSQQTSTQATQPAAQPGQPGQSTTPQNGASTSSNGTSPFAPPTPPTGIGGQTPSATPPQSSPFGSPAQMQ